MEELRQIVDKYREIEIDKEIATFDSLVAFSIRFYRDLADIYDGVTRIRNLDRNPNGFGINEAAILGLLEYCRPDFRANILLRSDVTVDDLQCLYKGTVTANVVKGVGEVAFDELDQFLKARATDGVRRRLSLRTLDETDQEAKHAVEVIVALMTGPLSLGHLNTLGTINTSRWELFGLCWFCARTAGKSSQNQPRANRLNPRPA